MRDLKAFTRDLAEASGEVISHYFRKHNDVSYKSNRTPLTAADTEAEEIMRQMIMRRYPDHGIIGEEFKTINPQAEYIWAIDPIDGTKSFISGTALFGTLIALVKNGRPMIGAFNNPILNQFLIGDGSQSSLNGDQVTVRSCQKLKDATLLTTSPYSVYQYQDRTAFDDLTSQVRLYRTWGDAYGYSLVATGFADVMLDPYMDLWDVAALVPIIEGAGGKITDYYGGDPLTGPGAIATAGGLHDKIISALNPKLEINGLITKPEA